MCRLFPALVDSDSRIGEAMNCRTCNSLINYNYVTECPQCGCVVEGGDLPTLDSSKRSKNNGGVWLRFLGNLVYVLITSAVAMISGAVVLYFSAALVYITLSTPEKFPGENCARGMAIGMLSILTGGFLGSVGGTAFGIKHPLFKEASNRSI